MNVRSWVVRPDTSGSRGRGERVRRFAGVGRRRRSEAYDAATAGATLDIALGAEPAVRLGHS